MYGNRKAYMYIFACMCTHTYRKTYKTKKKMLFCGYIFVHTTPGSGRDGGGGAARCGVFATEGRS